VEYSALFTLKVVSLWIVSARTKREKKIPIKRSTLAVTLKGFFAEICIVVWVPPLIY
jgi:hypothetical protein